MKSFTKYGLVLLILGCVMWVSLKIAASTEIMDYVIAAIFMLLGSIIFVFFGGNDD